MAAGLSASGPTSSAPRFHPAVDVGGPRPVVPGSGWRWRRCPGLGRGLTPFPVPSTSGRLTTTGPYRVGEAPHVRGHISRSARFRRSWAARGGRSALQRSWAFCSILKSSHEERFLRITYSDYANYSRTVRKRLLPGNHLASRTDRYPIGLEPWIENPGIIVAAPGRAGGALALAAQAGGHQIVGVISRSGSMADRFDQLSSDRTLPAGRPARDRDPGRPDRIDRRPSGALRREVGGVVHMSGFKSGRALAPFVPLGIETGSFHPLQSLSDAETGAPVVGRGLGRSDRRRAVSSGLLEGLAPSLEMTPFHAAGFGQAALSRRRQRRLQLRRHRSRPGGLAARMASVPFEAWHR